MKKILLLIPLSMVGMSLTSAKGTDYYKSHVDETLQVLEACKKEANRVGTTRKRNLIRHSNTCTEPREALYQLKREGKVSDEKFYELII